MFLVLALKIVAGKDQSTDTHTCVHTCIPAHIFSVIFTGLFITVQEIERTNKNKHKKTTATQCKNSIQALSPFVVQVNCFLINSEFLIIQ